MSKKAWVKDHKLIVVDHKLIVCDECPCGITIDAYSNSSCLGTPLSKNVSVGFLNGTYRLTYKSGAVSTGVGWAWNREYPGGCYGSCMPSCHAIYIGEGAGSGSIAPGFIVGGYPTAEEAEIASVGDFTDYTFTGQNIYMWYDDDNFVGNIGSITYSLVKIS